MEWGRKPIWHQLNDGHSSSCHAEPSWNFVGFAQSLIEDAFGGLDPRTAQDKMEVECYANLLRKLKPTFIPESKRHLQAILEDLRCKLSSPPRSARAEAKTILVFSRAALHECRQSMGNVTPKLGACATAAKFSEDSDEIGFVRSWANDLKRMVEYSERMYPSTSFAQGREQRRHRPLDQGPTADRLQTAV